MSPYGPDKGCDAGHKIIFFRAGFQGRGMIRH
jgi:hypothetical protein